MYYDVAVVVIKFGLLGTHLRRSYIDNNSPVEPVSVHTYFEVCTQPIIAFLKFHRLPLPTLQFPRYALWALLSGTPLELVTSHTRLQAGDVSLASFLSAWHHLLFS